MVDMATALNITPNALTNTAAPGVVSALIAKWKAYRIYRTSLNELSDLSNSELADLGLSRSMIKRVALEAAYDGI